MKKRLSANDAYFNRCMDYGSEAAAEKESESKLWEDLATWAFAEDPEIPADIPNAMAESLLDKAAREVKALRTVAAWKSAARYFEAENFHGLAGPACMRAKRLEKKSAKPAKKPTPARRKSRRRRAGKLHQ